MRVSGKVLKQFGCFNMCSEPNASGEIIQEMKRKGIREYCKFFRPWIKKGWRPFSEFRWLVHKAYEIFDPETGERSVVTLVGWKQTWAKSK